MGLAAKTNEKFEACRSARWELEIGVSIGGLRGWPGPMRARGGHSFGVRAAAVAAGSLRGRSCRYAALLPVLRERADRGGGTALSPFRLQHLPLCAQHHPQGGSQSPAPGRGTSCRPLASYHRVVSPPAPEYAFPALSFAALFSRSLPVSSTFEDIQNPAVCPSPRLLPWVFVVTSPRAPGSPVVTTAAKLVLLTPKSDRVLRVLRNPQQFPSALNGSERKG